MSNDLRPCPFCGGEAHFGGEVTLGVTMRSFAACIRCGLQTPRTPTVITEIDARRFWNTRTNDELLEAVKLAYRKHHLGDDTIGWNELSDTLLNALCNAMGDEAYLEWVKPYSSQDV